MKPTYKILIVLGIVVLVGLGIYFVWRKIATVPTIPQSINNSSSSLPASNSSTPSNASTNQNIPQQNKIGAPPQSTPKKISNGPVFDFWIDPATNEIYYLTPSGQVMTVQNGTNSQVSNQNINALNRISVSPNNKRILAAFGNPNAPQWGFFDTLDKVWRPLPSSILEAGWGADDTKLIALVQNNNLISLAWIDLSKTPYAYQTIINSFDLKNINFIVLPNQKILISEKPAANYSGRVWQLDPKNLTLNLLENEANGLTLNWSDDKSVAFQFSNGGGFLVLLGDLSQSVSNIFKTFPSKCNTASSTIYCFEPRVLPTDLTLPDDYFQKKFYSSDNLFSLSIDPATYGQINKIFVGGTNGAPIIDAKNPEILGKTVYFINRYDDYLYSLQVNQ